MLFAENSDTPWLEIPRGTPKAENIFLSAEHNADDPDSDVPCWIGKNSVQHEKPSAEMIE